MCDEVTPERIRSEVDRAYPDLAAFLAAAQQSLYNALWFGRMLPKLAGCFSASETFIRGAEWRPAVTTDTGRLDVAAGLFHFAEHDSAFEASLSAAYGELDDVTRLPRCPECDGLVGFDCDCRRAK